MPPREMPASLAAAARRVHSRAAAGPTPVVCFYADWVEVPLPPGHRFPMHKYAETRRVLTDDHSLRERLRLEPSPLASLDDVRLAHCPDYVDRVMNGRLSASEQRAVGFPWSIAHVQRSLASTGGTIAATRLVLASRKHRCALQIAGGTHHAHRDSGEGFCVFNDAACAAMLGLSEFGLRRILIVDLDVHQGQGTAAIFESRPEVTAFSMHQANGYPFSSRRRGPLDVELPDSTGDAEYLGTLCSWLPRLFDPPEGPPQLVLYQAGVDALQGDAFGRLALSRLGLQQRNDLIFSACIRARAPLVVMMGGGYTVPSDRSVAAHADVFRSAALRFSATDAADEAESSTAAVVDCM